MPNTLVDAGAGDDVLRGGENVGFTGGTGSDHITLTGENSPRSVHSGTGQTEALGDIKYRLEAGQRRTLRLSLSRSERRLVAQPSGRLYVRLRALSGSDPNRRDVRWRVRIKR